MKSFSPFQDIRVKNGVGLVPGAETDTRAREADLDREREGQGVHAAMREDGGVARDRETERDDEEAERSIDLAVEVAAGQERDDIQGRLVMTVMNQAGEKSKLLCLVYCFSI